MTGFFYALIQCLKFLSAVLGGLLGGFSPKLFRLALAWGMFPLALGGSFRCPWTPQVECHEQL